MTQQGEAHKYVPIHNIYQNNVKKTQHNRQTDSNAIQQLLKIDDDAAELQALEDGEADRKHIILKR